MSERKYLRKRLYGISPYIDLIIPNPRDGRTRAIMSKKNDLECKNTDNNINFINFIFLVKDNLLKQPIKTNAEKKYKFKSISKDNFISPDNMNKLNKLNTSYDLQMFHVYEFMK